jgi:hypothetical protein
MKKLFTLLFALGLGFSFAQSLADSVIPLESSGKGWANKVFEQAGMITYDCPEVIASGICALHEGVNLAKSDFDLYGEHGQTATIEAVTPWQIRGETLQKIYKVDNALLLVMVVEEVVAIVGIQP